MLAHGQTGPLLSVGCLVCPHHGVKEKLIELNNTKLEAKSTGTGRFGNWLENLVDWNLSRSRFWVPLPIWRTEEELREKMYRLRGRTDPVRSKSCEAGMDENPFEGFIPGDYSKENYSKIESSQAFYVDNLVLVRLMDGRCTVNRPIDVWLIPGDALCPMALSFLPLRGWKNQHRKSAGRNGLGEAFLPISLLKEWIDPRMVFTLHTIVTIISGSVAFRNIISNGLVLDKNGNKMSNG